jgi:hypothetical protein
MARARGLFRRSTEPVGGGAATVVRVAHNAPASARSADPPPSGSPSVGPLSAGPLPALVAARVRLSADLLAALLEVEQRQRATLDDLEWADAVADRMLRRRLARRAPV